MLVVKTMLGFGQAGDSYASLADADDFHAERGAADWTAATTTVREEKLRLATDWLDINYRWDLSLPRATETLGEYVGFVPAAVIRATIMLAREALTVTLASTQQDRMLMRERVKVDGAVEREREYDGGLRQRFPWLDPMLAPYTLAGSGGSIRLARA